MSDANENRALSIFILAVTGIATVVLVAAALTARRRIRHGQVQKYKTADNLQYAERLCPKWMQGKIEEELDRTFETRKEIRSRFRGKSAAMQDATTQHSATSSMDRGPTEC
eukprot:TRINITY_DN4994_c0_g1_i1.p2 TRINITY_DN4994_c0_g1~~TRINITY_DN4994_c0_g1_i1.p2  ORF type:complete len:111 (+),score=8.14 TRINITY_DN4994_c0_g1_i1:24-356(+)